MMDNTKTAEKKYNFRVMMRYFLRHWWCFALSVIVFMSLGYLYVKIKSPLWVVHSSLMFNQNEDDEGGRGGILGSIMSSFSLGSGVGVNVDDEMYKINSHTALMNVTRELELNKIYSSKPGLFKRKIWYYKNSPIAVDIPESVLDTISASTDFRIKVSKDGKEAKIKVKQGEYKTVYNKTTKLPATIKTPLATFVVRTTSYYHPGESLDFSATLTSADNYAKGFVEHIGVAPVSKRSNAVELQVEDVNTERASDVLNSLMSLYNEKSMSTRSEQSRATLEFLHGRLLKLYKELDASESDIAAYKRDNKFVSPEAEAEYIFKMKQQADGGLIELETQLGILKMLKEFLVNESNQYSLVPITGLGTTGAGTSGDGVNAAVNAYNTLVMERMKLQANAKSSNATLRQLEGQIEAMRGNLVQSLDRSIIATDISIGRMSKGNGTIESRISSMPRMEQELTNLYRDQEIKNRIYAYLLQKSEETEIKLARVLPTGMVIDYAYTEMDPESPKKNLVYGFMFVLGLLVPGFWLFTRGKKMFVHSAPAVLKKEEDEFERELESD